MATNAFYCSKCRKNTRHLEIKAEEYLALQGIEGTQLQIERIISRMGIYEMLQNIQGHRYWKCSECLYPSEKNLSGKDVWDK